MKKSLIAAALLLTATFIILVSAFSPPPTGGKCNQEWEKGFGKNELQSSNYSGHDVFLIYH